MENKFLGSGWAFPPVFASGGTTVEMVSGEEDIKQSLQILLSTSLKERVMHSGFGCDLNRFLFEEVDQRFVNDISNMVSRSILLYEPRIKVEGVTVKDMDIENGVVHIAVDYIVRTTNNRFNLVYPFYINEASTGAFTL
ncbi:GPW/gp25 family protein [Flavobacterium jejuense]|uniref:GPW/gp25 family protein n=1 Tax=Flavobacterium jejuense TaxID=1544455 RepID=A0ABX0INL4_9FLAO|nr:GPW/gp25 family protein [Flavobacterium jejuense]NHN24073.1 GPW/gp25 family protein [Flavobacterium jejuense]